MEEFVVSTIDLPGGSLLPRTLVESASVRILKGRVWITEEGFPSDVFLASGEESRFQGSGRVVIEALVPARIELTERPRRSLSVEAARLARAAISKPLWSFTRLRRAMARAIAPSRAGCTVR